MTPLRRQLRSAARAYGAVRYPGDLAAEVLPARKPLSSYSATNRATFFRTSASISALAALVLLAVLLRPAPRPSEPTVARTGGDPDRPAVTLLPPHGPAVPVPVPAVHVPTLPRRVPETLPQDLDVEAYRMHYQDLAQQVPELPPALRRLTVPKLSDLPDKGLDWLHKVWTADESAA